MIGFYKDRWPMEKMHAMGKEEFLTEVKNAGYKW